MIKTVEWTKDGVRMLDQRLLPSEETYLMLRSYDEVAEAIKKMVIRGAPAIGIAAAMGIALGASQSVGTSVADLEDDLQYICDVMGKTRPTAVNLFWAIERMRGAFQAKQAPERRGRGQEGTGRRSAQLFTKKTSPRIARSDTMVDH